MNDIMKIVQAHENCNLLLKEVTKTSKKETKEQKGGFLNMLLGSLGARLLGNMLTEKEMLRAGYVHGKGVLRAYSGNKMNF